MLHRIYEHLTFANNITVNDREEMKKRKHEIPTIYLLPKIHKAKDATSRTYVGRPIISACCGQLKMVDLLITKTTEPLLKRLPGSIADTTDLLIAITNLTPPTNKTILFSADVTTLYPSIPTNEGINACTKYYSDNYQFLCRYAHNEQQLPPMQPSLFKEILTLVLKNNIFHFQNQSWYRQIKGPEMGASISVFFANVFMYSRTSLIIHNMPPQLKLFVRHIDDIISVWEGNENEIEPTFEQATDTNIKLTWVKSRTQLAALDVLIYIKNNKYETNLYTKPTDAPLYVHCPLLTTHRQDSSYFFHIFTRRILTLSSSLSAGGHGNAAS